MGCHPPAPHRDCHPDSSAQPQVTAACLSAEGSWQSVCGLRADKQSSVWEWKAPLQSRAQLASVWVGEQEEQIKRRTQRTRLICLSPHQPRLPPTSYNKLGIHPLPHSSFVHIPLPQSFSGQQGEITKREPSSCDAGRRRRKVLITEKDLKHSGCDQRSRAELSPLPCPFSKGKKACRVRCASK